MHGPLSGLTASAVGSASRRATLPAASVQPAFRPDPGSSRATFAAPPETGLEMQSTHSSRTTAAARAAAYRRLACTILGLDVPTLVADLRAQRLGQDSPTPLVAPRSPRVA